MIQPSRQTKTLRWFLEQRSAFRGLSNVLALTFTPIGLFESARGLRRSPTLGSQWGLRLTRMDSGLAHVLSVAVRMSSPLLNQPSSSSSSAVWRVGLSAGTSRRMTGKICRPDTTLSRTALVGNNGSISAQGVSLPRH